MYKLFKRVLDFISALRLLVLISPLFLVLMALVCVKLAAPIFFKQERVTKDLHRFYIMKFRTRTDARDAEGRPLPDEQRMTPFGSFLRSTSLDELPELLNIIKGDMSVIGPRPLPPVYDAFYTDSEKTGFRVRGSLILPDSVADSAIVSWDTQLKYEAAYGQDPTFKKDAVIFINAFKILFFRQNTDCGEFVREPLNVERSYMATDCNK